MRGLKIICIILISIVLTGCWDGDELEDQSYVVAMGIDKGLEEDNLVITLQIANPQVGSSDTAKAEKEPAQEIITFLVPDMVVIRDLANISVSRRITYDQMRTMIVSEELMKEGMFFNLLDSITRDPEFQRDVKLIISKEKANEFINNQKHLLETRPHKHYAFMAERWKDTGLSPETEIGHLLQRTEEDAGLYLAAYATVVKEEEKGKQDGEQTQSTQGGQESETQKSGESEDQLKLKEGQKYGKEDDYIAGEVIKKGGNPTQMIGSAVIKEGVMIGTLTGEETRLALLMRPKSEVSNWKAVYKDPLHEKKHISARLLKAGKTDIKVNIKDGKLTIDCKVKADLKILLIRSFENYISDIKLQKKLEQSIEKQLEIKAMDLVEKTQQDLNGDIFQWHLPGRKEFLTVNEYKDFNWMEQYPNAIVNVEFDISITNFGKQLDPIDADEIRE
ncbi:Ger(x)C family spore germination protein [Haloplasma contractile]|uniref:Spore germination protein GRKC n=1 Tax=Haloplasma contractile SSD-17B TaxID=1033810 RepID=U2FGS3_9MOLU|nr:Ger(x)C family spore germination protein [Haloplasma contractile]ERJ12050.1 Spore germination protein GRKC [Haloplasma contractile SSD-17B]